MLTIAEQHQAFSKLERGAAHLLWIGNCRSDAFEMLLESYFADNADASYEQGKAACNGAIEAVQSYLAQLTAEFDAWCESFPEDALHDGEPFRNGPDTCF